MSLSVPATEFSAILARPGINAAAVSNFLASLAAHGDDSHAAFENARADAKSCRWNADTLGAVVDGICAAMNAENARRRGLKPGECPGCAETGFRPSHDGSPSCESGSIASGGKTAHCSCSRCF